MNYLSTIRKAGFEISLAREKDLSVAPFQLLTLSQKEFLKQHKAAIINELTEENIILDWLASIGETDADTIAETLDRCNEDSETRNYFLKRARGEL